MGSSLVVSERWCEKWAQTAIHKSALMNQEYILLYLFFFFAFFSAFFILRKITKTASRDVTGWLAVFNQKQP